MSEPITELRIPVKLDYRIVAGADLARFLTALKEGKILGRKDPATGRVYCPPRTGSPTHGTEMGPYVLIAETGILTSFCVVNVQFEGQVMKVPYLYGSIVLDGANTPFLHLIHMPVADARMGLRVRAKWKPEAEREGSFTDIAWFEPTGEPDAAFESFSEYL